MAQSQFRTTHHPPLRAVQERPAELERKVLAAIARQRSLLEAVAPAPGTAEITLSTVSEAKQFDAYVDIHLVGSDTPATVVVDSGNPFLIHPKWEDIAAIPGYAATYQDLGDSTEPWGCPAKIVKGPIEFITTSGAPVRIDTCVFYACTGDAPNGGGRTANLGTGCVSPWPFEDIGGQLVTLMSPLAQLADYRYAVFDYAAAEELFHPEGLLQVSAASRLVLSNAEPAGFTSFPIPDGTWMSLVPKGLWIDGQKTDWPGATPSPIAMVDTGGTCAYLSDPKGYVYKQTWPDPVANPGWASSSELCVSTASKVRIEIGDENQSYAFDIDPDQLPQSARGLTLVMCKKNKFMMGQNGMNIGGISALFNLILVDYGGSRVGFQPKNQEAGLVH